MSQNGACFAPSEPGRLKTKTINLEGTDSCTMDCKAFLPCSSELRIETAKAVKSSSKEFKTAFISVPPERKIERSAPELTGDPQVLFSAFLLNKETVIPSGACNYVDLACVPNNDQYSPGECKTGSLDLHFPTPMLNVLKPEDNDSEHTCAVEVKMLCSVIDNLDSEGNTPQSHNRQINVPMLMLPDQQSGCPVYRPVRDPQFSLPAK